MACTLSNKCAKNLSKRTVLLQLIIKNVVTCFFGTQCIYCIISPTADRVYDVSRFNSITPKTVATCANSCKISIARFLRDSRACHCGLYRYRIPKNASSGVWLSTAVNCWCIDTVIRHHHIPLSTSITPSLFHSRLKTYLFNKSFPPS